MNNTYVIIAIPILISLAIGFALIITDKPEEQYVEIEGIKYISTPDEPTTCIEIDLDEDETVCVSVREPHNTGQQFGSRYAYTFSCIEHSDHVHWVYITFEFTDTYHTTFKDIDIETSEHDECPSASNKDDRKYIDGVMPFP